MKSNTEIAKALQECAMNWLRCAYCPYRTEANCATRLKLDAARALMREEKQDE